MENATNLSLSEVEIWYPHVAKKLVTLWGTELCNLYLDELMLMNRHDQNNKLIPREGFSLLAMSELLTVMDIHHGIVPPKATYDPWYDATKGKYL